jgi:protein deglycase
VDVTIAGLQDEKTIVLARQAKLVVDALFSDVVGKYFDAVILPGGQPGSDNLAKVFVYFQIFNFFFNILGPSSR